MAARKLHRLTALEIAKLDAPGQYPDGGNLYFQISLSGSRSWIFKFTLCGRAREMGIGPLSMVSLAQTRAKAAECRLLLKNKIDPIESRKEQRRKIERYTQGPRLADPCAQAPAKQPRGICVPLRRSQTKLGAYSQ